MNAPLSPRRRWNEPPALLERLGTVAFEMGRAGLSKAIVWAVLGLLAGVLADLVSYVVAKSYADGSMPLGPQVLSLVTLGIPVLVAGAFAFHGAQVGAIAAGFQHETEVRVLEWLVRRGLEATLPRLPDERSPSRAQVDRAVREASRELLGERLSRWTGPVGLVARVVHGTLTSVYERALAAALVDTHVSKEALEIPEETAKRAHDALVASLEELLRTVLGLERAVLFVGVTVCALIWYPVCSVIVRFLPF